MSLFGFHFSNAHFYIKWSRFLGREQKMGKVVKFNDSLKGSLFLDNKNLGTFSFQSYSIFWKFFCQALPCGS